MNFKKTALILLAALLLGTASQLAGAADAPAVGKIISSVNFRTGPSTSYSQIRYLQPGESVQILEKVNAYWYKIKDSSGKIGYVSTSERYITVQAQPTEQTTQSSATIVNSVSFRTGPSTSYSRIRYLQAGENVQILEKVNAYWYKVKDKNGQIGYVSTSAQYIKVLAQPSGQTTQNSATVVNSVSFRTGPSTSYSRIRYLQAGESVQILEKVNAYWYKVKDKNGQIGYVSTSTQYLRLTTATPAPAPNPPSVSQQAQKVINAGMKYLGTPYEYGSSRSDTSTFDCSDFVRQAYLDGIGLRLPADSRQQGDFVKNLGHYITDWRKLQPGDIMFFMDYKGSRASDYAGINKSTQRITHDGIYLGNGKILHTYSVSSGGVRIDDIAGRSWEYRFIFGGSPLK